MRQNRVAIFVVLSFFASSAFAAKPNVDTFGASRGKNSSEASVAARVGKLAKAGHRIQIEPRLGVPTMLWTDSPAEIGINGPVTRPSSERPEVAVARAHLTHYAAAYGLDARDVTSAVVSHVHNTGKGPVIVKLRQEIGGIEIFREEMSVVMTKDLDAVAIGGYISSAATPGFRGGDMSFRRDRRTAAADAVTDAIAKVSGAQLVAAGSRDGYDFYNVAGASGVYGYGPVMTTPADPASGDYRAKTTGPNEFLSQATGGTEPKLLAPRMGGIQQLFYNINFLHDWFYDSGFDEAAGNAQASNYGRGGLENDSIRGQAQDVAGRNNANMLTPADGSRPRMRMYLFDMAAPKYGDVLSPGSIAGRRSIGTGTFGPQSFDLTAPVLMSAPHHGCTAFTNAADVAGKIVMVG